MEAADSSERLANVFQITFTAVRASKVRPCSAPNKTAKVPRRHAAHRTYADIFLHSKCHTVSRYNHKCNFIDVHGKSTAFPACRFSRNSQILDNMKCRYFNTISFKSDNKECSSDTRSFNYGWKTRGFRFVALILHETHHRTINCSGNHPLRILPKLDDKCETYGRNFFHARK